MTNKTHNTFHIVTVLSIIALSLCLWRSCTKPLPEPTIEIVYDTVYLHSVDTITVTKENIRYVEKKVTDTLYLHDTILFREQLVYEDSLSTIYVSGIEPSIDSVKHYIPRDTVLINTNTTITQIKKKNFGQYVGIGVGIGYGVSMTPKPQFSPYVGVSITYGFGYTW